MEHRVHAPRTFAHRSSLSSPPGAGCEPTPGLPPHGGLSAALRPHCSGPCPGCTAACRKAHHREFPGTAPRRLKGGKLQRHASTSLRQRAVTQESAWAGLRYCGGAGYPHTPYPCAPCPWLAALHCTAWRSLHLPLSLPPAWPRCAAPCAARATSAPSPPAWPRKAAGAWAPISLPTRWPPFPKPSAASPACARVAPPGSSRGEPRRPRPRPRPRPRHRATEQKVAAFRPGDLCPGTGQDACGHPRCPRGGHCTLHRSLQPFLSPINKKEHAQRALFMGLSVCS